MDQVESFERQDRIADAAADWFAKCQFANRAVQANNNIAIAAASSHAYCIAGNSACR